MEFGIRVVLSNDAWPSDHLGVIAELQIKREGNEIERGNDGKDNDDEANDCRCGCKMKGLPM